jgi:hypothetical protein
VVNRGGTIWGAGYENSLVEHTDAIPTPREARMRLGVTAAAVLSVVLGMVVAGIGALRPVHEGWLALAAFLLVLSSTVQMLRHGASGLQPLPLAAWVRCFHALGIAQDQVEVRAIV